MNLGMLNYSGRQRLKSRIKMAGLASTNNRKVQLPPPMGEEHKARMKRAATKGIHREIMVYLIVTFFTVTTTLLVISILQNI